MVSVRAGLINGVFGLIGNALNNRAEMNLAKYQTDANIKMWQMQNEYNSPAAQMQRYKDAGLNPNLIYGNISSGNSSSAPNAVVGRPTYDVGSIANSALSTYLSHLSAYQDIKKSNQEIEESQSRSAVNRAQEALIGQQRVNAAIASWNDMLKYHRGQFDYFKDRQLFPYQLQQQQGIVRGQWINILNGLADLRHKQQLYDFNESVNPYRLDRMRFENAPLKYRADLITRNGYDPGLPLSQGVLSLFGDTVNDLEDGAPKIGKWFADKWHKFTNGVGKSYGNYKKYQGYTPFSY